MHPKPETTPGTPPLPCALHGDFKSLCPDALKEIRSLAGAKPAAFLTQAISAWLVIACAIIVSQWLDHILATLGAILLIGTRQNVLGLLIHEQAHHLGFKHKFGDLIANLLAGYPLLVLNVNGYAQVHLAHHRDYFTEKDPDFIRKSGDEWRFPMKASKFALILLKDISAMNLIALIRGKSGENTAKAFPRRWTIPSWIPLTYYICVVCLLTYTQTWHLFLIYWVLPLITIFQVIVRWGAVCEHKYNELHASVAETSPIIIHKWWEKLLFPDLNFSMHPYHHYFPNISFSMLPKVHQIFQREGLVCEENIYWGNWEYLKYLITELSPAPNRKADSVTP